MRNRAIITAAITLLQTHEALAPYPGIKELVIELQILQQRLFRHHRQHNHDHTTDTFTVDNIEYVVDYCYTPYREAPSAGSHDDPNFSVPPDSEGLDILKAFSHDNLVNAVRGDVFCGLRDQILERERNALLQR